MATADNDQNGGIEECAMLIKALETPKLPKESILQGLLAIKEELGKNSLFDTMLEVTETFDSDLVEATAIENKMAFFILSVKMKHFLGPFISVIMTFLYVRVSGSPRSWL